MKKKVIFSFFILMVLALLIFPFMSAEQNESSQIQKDATLSPPLLHMT